MTNLPVNIDSSYIDNASDPTVALHQQHHDIIHAAINKLGGYGSGTLAARPTAAIYGVGFYFAVDDNSGTLYYSDGTTWTKQAPGLGETAGVELGYAEVTSSQTVTSHTQADLPTPLSITVTVGSRPVLLEAYIPQAYVSVAVGSVGIAIVEGTTTLVTANVTTTTWGTGNVLPPIFLQRRLMPTAGTHSYKVQAAAGGTSTLNLYGPGGGMPSVHLRAVSL